MKSATHFSINDYSYTLCMRRALEIENGKLISYNTEYEKNKTVEEKKVLSKNTNKIISNGANMPFADEITDPFLIKILEEKRRHCALTDIIRTIQSTQNEIIRKDKNESFIIQGCAGSGKTMILLHRLSYLKFNNRFINWKNVKIITPNKQFETFINDLSIELELNEIEKLSIDEYYTRLIMTITDKKKIYDARKVMSEDYLANQLLASIYSESFYENMQLSYHSAWKNAIAMLIEKGLLVIVEKLNIENPNLDEHNEATYNQLIIIINEIRKRKYILNKNEIDSIELIEEIVYALNFDNLFSNTMLFELKNLYRQNGTLYTNSIYRHTLYINLLFCSLYYTYTKITDNLLNIDEAQDISVVEYKVLNSILCRNGNNCIFNLYGDTNQLLYSYKGIDNWDKLRNTISSNVYFLNENYRNTYEITSFCNNSFNMNVIPIGISGEIITGGKLDSGISWIQEEKKKYNGSRCAVIYGKKISSQINKIEMKCKKSACDISFLTVDMVKGQEFEYVLVVENYMTKNERYVAYTRALKKLRIVSL